MLLALSIISGQSGELGATAYKVFDERGGSIGRIAGNDWVLPDPQNFVSSRHARVSAAGGTFYLEDTSSNGTFINAPDQAASRAAPQPLNDGDRLYIGDYEIIVQIIPDEPQASALGLGTVDPLAALAGTAAPPVASTNPAEAVRAGAPQAARPAAPAAPDFEAIVHLAVQGLVTVLRSRTEVKNSFRLPTTSVKAVENNPLKFSQNAEDAFDNLFVKHNPGYLGPVDAFREGFDDVAFHQSAMLAGIRAAFSAMLAKLHPQKLEELYERKLKRTAVLGLGNKAKYWEMYRAQFEEIDRDREAHFQLLFGEEFALAYNEHLQKLMADARLRKQR
jgi:predicted component of type VI protein secretion system